MDPLANLKDIHLPEQVGIWPLAYGWWILIAVVCVLLGFAVYRMTVYFRLHKFRRAALKQLKHGQIACPTQLVALLKAVAMHYFPREDCASLYQENFVAYLADKLAVKRKADFIQLISPQLENQYSAQSNTEAEPQQLLNAGVFWLRHVKVNQGAAT